MTTSKTKPNKPVAEKATTKEPTNKKSNGKTDKNSIAKSASITPLLEYRSVSKSYGDRTVLKDINLTIPRGRIIGLLGKNGAGKTTLIKLANDLLQPTSGEVLVEGNRSASLVKSKFPISRKSLISTKLCVSKTP